MDERGAGVGGVLLLEEASLSPTTRARMNQGKGGLLFAWSVSAGNMCGFVCAFSSSSNALSKKTRAARFVRIGAEHNAVLRGVTHSALRNQQERNLGVHRAQHRRK